MMRAITKSLALLVVLASLLACREKKDPLRGAASGVDIPPKPPEHPNPSPEALARKARSEAWLRREKVEVASSLPVIDTEAEARVRARDEVVDRALALMIVALKGEGVEDANVAKEAARFGAERSFSPKEKAFFADPRPSDSARIQFGWRYECLDVMLWALGFRAELGRPNAMTDAGQLVALVMKDKGPDKLRAEAQLRSAKELLDEADLIYRYDWACVDARVGGKTPPAGVNCEVVVERHHALKWLVGYQNQAWDDVSTDT